MTVCRRDALAACALACLCLPFAAGGEEADTRALEGLRVEGTPAVDPEADAADRSAFVTVIDVASLADTATSVPELLRKTVGVTIRQFGGPGSLATASIRGSSAEQVSILMDGVPLNRARSGAVNLSNLPVRIIERIEVYRGFAPLRHSTSAVGGVVNIVTRRPETDQLAEASGSYGSFGTYELNGAQSGGGKRLSHLLSVSVAGSDGDFEFKDDNGTRVEPSDDEITDRENNDFDAYDLFGKVAWTPTETLRIEASAEHFDKDEGVPGISANQSESARLDTERSVVNVRLGQRRLGVPELSGSLRLFALREETRFRDLLGEIGIGIQDNANESVAAGGELYGDYFLGQNHLVSFTGSVQRERFDSHDDVTSQTFENQERTVYQAGLEDRVFLAGGRVILEPQVLYTRLDNDFPGAPDALPPVPEGSENDDYLTYRLGARADLTDSLVARFNAGRAYRYPNLTELFGDRGTVIGNPGLDPEESFKWDAGLAWAPGEIRLGALTLQRPRAEAAVFMTDADDLILFEQNSQRTVRPVNISEAETWGVETAVAVSLFDWLDLKGNFTWIDAENTSDIPFLRGNQLPGVPERELYLRADVRLARVRAWYEFDYLDDNYLDRANFEKIEDRKIHNVGLSLVPDRRLTLTFEVKNLGDERVVDVLGFPLPGRSYVGTLLAKF